MLPSDDNWMWALATHPTILDMIEMSLGKDAVLYASVSFPSPPRSAIILLLPAKPFGAAVACDFVPASILYPDLPCLDSNCIARHLGG